MIINSDLQTILETATDFDVVCEIYNQDATPPFDPADAELRFASIGGLEFAGEVYEKKIERINRATRTISNEVNNCSVVFSNENLEVATYELTEGFEGKIMVLRLISRSKSTTLSKSLILFVGRCERPLTANKKNITVQSVQIVGAIDVEMPRRQFKVDDPEGRNSNDVLFEGFRYTPQFGTVEYSVRKRHWWASWLISSTQKKYQGFSSYSDIDQNRWVPVVLGRAQMMGMHLGYVDVGTFIRTTTAFCEGPIEDFTWIRTDDQRFQFYNDTTVTFMNGYQKRYGYAGNTGPVGKTQIPQSYSAFIANGYYSKTALLFTVMNGTDTLQDDAAPGIISVVYGTLMTVPNNGGAWIVPDTWSDNPAAHTRYLLTAPEYFNLDPAWLNDSSFFDAFQYNDSWIYDSSNGELIQVPNDGNFDSGDSALGKYLTSTAKASGIYFNYLSGNESLTDTFNRTPLSTQYTTAGIIDGPEEPTGTPPEGRLPSSMLDFSVRRRYTSNVAITDRAKVTDVIHDVLFSASRMFFSQDEQGRLKLNHKKPVDNARATGSISGTSVSVDDVSPWMGDLSGFALIDPNTTNSEIRMVTAANYSTATPTLTVGTNLTATAFSGGNGSTTPQSAKITAAGFGGTVYQSSFTLDGVQIDFNAGIPDDDVAVAGWIHAAINGNPILSRKFLATWGTDKDFVDIYLKSGTLTLDEATTQTHAAPLSNPTTAPTLTAASGGNLDAGTVVVVYSYVNDRGETMVSPRQTVTVTAGQKITVSAITPPAGAEVNWYCSTIIGGWELRQVKRNNGASFDITNLPSRNAPHLPIFNSTSAEILRVSAAFSDRAEDRAQRPSSNVLKASYKWRLGNRKQVKNFVEIQYRDPSQDFRLVTLNLKNEESIDKIKKTNKLTINGSAIDSYNQAYRIASGALTENLDADFFYSWTADRGALLLEEGDVVAITDGGSGVINLPVRIEQIEFDPRDGFVEASFTGRKYATTLYDDSVAERQIPVVIETGFNVNFV